MINLDLLNRQLDNCSEMGLIQVQNALNIFGKHINKLKSENEALKKQLDKSCEGCKNDGGNPWVCCTCSRNFSDKYKRSHL